MNVELTKQACIDYIYGIEKEALDLEPIVEMGKKLLSSGIGKKVVGAVTSDAGKKILATAGTGALIGGVTAKGSNGQSASIGNIAGGALKGGLVGGALGSMGSKLSAGKTVPTMGADVAGINTLGGPIHNASFTTASEAIDGLCIQKVAEDLSTKPDNEDFGEQIKAPNHQAPKMPKEQPTLNSETAGRTNSDTDIEQSDDINTHNAFEVIEQMFDKIAEEQQDASIPESKVPLSLSEKTTFNLLQDKLDRGNRLDSNSLDKYESFISRFVHNSTKMINPQDKIALNNILLPKLRKGMASKSDIESIKNIIDNIRGTSLQGEDKEKESSTFKTATEKEDKEEENIPGTSSWIKKKEKAKKNKKEEKVAYYKEQILEKVSSVE